MQSGYSLSIVKTKAKQLAFAPIGARPRDESGCEASSGKTPYEDAKMLGVGAMFMTLVNVNGASAWASPLRAKTVGVRHIAPPRHRAANSDDSGCPGMNNTGDVAQRGDYGDDMGQPIIEQPAPDNPLTEQPDLPPATVSPCDGAKARLESDKAFAETARKNLEEATVDLNKLIAIADPTTVAGAQATEQERAAARAARPLAEAAYEQRRASFASAGAAVDYQANVVKILCPVKLAVDKQTLEEFYSDSEVVQFHFEDFGGKQP